MVGFIKIHETTPNSMLREQPLVDSISLMEHVACPIGIYVQDQVEDMTLHMFKSIIQGTTIQFSVFPSTKIFGTFDEVRHNPNYISQKSDLIVVRTILSNLHQ